MADVTPVLRLTQDGAKLERKKRVRKAPEGVKAAAKPEAPEHNGEFVGNPGHEADPELLMLLALVGKATTIHEASKAVKAKFPDKRPKTGSYKNVYCFKKWVVKIANDRYGESLHHVQKESAMWSKLTKLERRFFAEIVFVFPWGHIQRFTPPLKSQRHCADRGHICGHEYPTFKKAVEKYYLSDVGDGVRNHVHRRDKKGKVYPVIYDYGYNDGG